MWEELGISGGTAIIILIALYFVLKWAIRNGIEEAYNNITGKHESENAKIIAEFEQMEKEEQEELEKRRKEKEKAKKKKD